MRISTLIAVQTGALVTVGLALASLVTSSHGAALKAQGKSARYSVEGERFERVAELTSQLILVGDLVLSGQTTYLNEVAKRASSLARESIEGSLSRDFLEEARIDRGAICQLILDLEGMIMTGSQITGSDREERLYDLFESFDTKSMQLGEAIDAARAGLESGLRNSLEEAERQTQSASHVALWSAAAFLGLILLLWTYLRRTIQKPITQLTGAAENAERSGRFEGTSKGPLEVKRLSSRFAGLFENMSRALETRASFVANTSHELRTPLNAILGYAEFLAEETPTADELEEGLQSIHSSGTHLLSLINDVLDLSKIDADQMTIDRIPTDIRELVEQVRAILAGTADEKGLELIIDVDPLVPTQLDLDPVRVRQVILNVAGNALKFTGEGSVTITATFEANRLQVTVRDTGIGIPAERLERIFEDFQQADASSTRVYGGTGLGLAISRRLSRLMGGDLWATSEIGQGAEFTILMEAIPVAADPVAALPKDETCESEERSLRVLLADDVELNRRLGKRILERAGHTVTLVNDGVEVLEVFQGAQEDWTNAFDVVLMDLQMPRLSGLEATSQLRDQGYDGPIIALTAAVLSEERANAFAAGCTDFVTKPFAPKELLAKLAQAADEAAESVKA